MNPIFYKYDIFPMVIPANKESVITIKPVDFSSAFEAGKVYDIRILPTDEGWYRNYPDRDNDITFTAVAESDGSIKVKYAFGDEQMYFIRISKPEDNFKNEKEFRVYAVAEDLQGRYPFMGDLHIHTRRSDGREAPETVVSNYRQYGYDFIAVTDHRRYYPSLDAIAKFKDVPIEMAIFPGEEVHMSNSKGRIDPHIVAFGGEFSVNALRLESEHDKDVGTDLSRRAIRTENVPDVMTDAEFEAIIEKEAEKYADEIPYESERYTYAGMKWIFDKIREANGLAIFAHPYWLNEARHVPETFLEYIMEKHEFDAFEVLGGENYFEHNGFQTIRYYEDLAKGRKYPIVGSTDSHSSLPTNRNRDVCETMVFAHENERKDIIASIKDFYSVAIDTISKEPRFVGDMRLVRYACFLKDYFFPLHDELCFEEGRAMRAYAMGDESAADVLRAINGRMKRQREKYFAI